MKSRVATTPKVPRAHTCESSRISRAISTVQPISSARNKSASTPLTCSVTLVFSDLVDGADVGVIQPGGRPRFPDQAASRLLVRHRPGRESLDGDFAP